MKESIGKYFEVEYLWDERYNVYFRGHVKPFGQIKLSHSQYVFCQTRTSLEPEYTLEKLVELSAFLAKLESSRE